MKSKIEKYKKMESELSNLKDEIETRVDKMASYMLKNDPDLKRKKIYGSVDNFSIENKVIVVSVSEYRGCGEYDFNSFEIDIELFQSDNWLELMTSQVEEKLEKLRKEEELNKAIEKAKRIEYLKKELNKIQEEDK